MILKRPFSVLFIGLVSTAVSIIWLLPLFNTRYQSIIEMLSYPSNAIRCIFFLILFFSSIGLLALKNWARLSFVGLFLSYIIFVIYRVYFSVVLAPRRHPDMPKWFFRWNDQGYLILFSGCLLLIIVYLTHPKIKDYFHKR